MTDMGAHPDIANLTAAALGQDRQQRNIYRLAADGTILWGAVGYGDGIR